MERSFDPFIGMQITDLDGNVWELRKWEEEWIKVKNGKQ